MSSLQLDQQQQYSNNNWHFWLILEPLLKDLSKKIIWPRSLVFHTSSVLYSTLSLLQSTPSLGRTLPRQLVMIISLNLIKFELIINIKIHSPLREQKNLLLRKKEREDLVDFGFLSKVVNHYVILHIENKI